MATRNYWIEVVIDGRKTKLEGGPRSKDGGFELRIYQRDEGKIKTAFSINGHAIYDEKRDEYMLATRIYDRDGHWVATDTSWR